MFAARLLTFTTALALSVPAPARQWEGASGEVAQRLLDAQNLEREAVGAPLLQWDAELASHAASYGPTLARLRTLVHSPRESRPGERENLAMAWHGTLTPERLVNIWSREKGMIKPGGGKNAGGEKPTRSRTKG